MKLSQKIKLGLDETRMLILGALNWTAEWYEPKRGKSASVVADQAVAMVLHGLVAGDGVVG